MVAIASWMSFVRTDTVYSLSLEFSDSIFGLVTDYVAHPNTVFPRAHDVQSCQIGNFCTNFGIWEPKVGQLHLDLRITLDLFYRP